MPNTLSVALITLNEAANLPRTLASVRWAHEIVVVDSGSTDATRSIAQSFGARLFRRPWKGFAAQKNSSIGHATGEWILSLDADEEVSPELAQEIKRFLPASQPSTPIEFPVSTISSAGRCATAAIGPTQTSSFPPRHGALQASARPRDDAG